MILITRLNGSQLYLNAELVQTVEGTPDTVITLTNNVKIVVRDKPQAVIERIMRYQQAVRDRLIDANLMFEKGE
jgi:flagellar protein FlbD